MQVNELGRRRGDDQPTSTARRWKLKLVAAIGLGAILATVFASVALGFVTYASWATYGAGSQITGNFEGGSTWWWWQNRQIRNVDEPKQGKITFIKSGGGWECTVTNSNVTVVGCNLAAPIDHYKKPMCRNHDSVSFVFRCEAVKTTA